MSMKERINGYNIQLIILILIHITMNEGSDICCIKINENNQIKMSYGYDSCAPEKDWYINTFYYANDYLDCFNTSNVFKNPFNIDFLCCFYGNMDINKCFRSIGTYTGCGFAQDQAPIGTLIGFYPIPSKSYPNVSSCYYEYTCN